MALGGSQVHSVYSVISGQSVLEHIDIQEDEPISCN